MKKTRFLVIVAFILFLVALWVQSIAWFRLQLADYYEKSGQEEKTILIYKKIFRREQIKTCMKKRKFWHLAKLYLNYQISLLGFKFVDFVVSVNIFLADKVDNIINNCKTVVISQPIKQVLCDSKFYKIRKSNNVNEINLLTITNLNYESKFYGVRELIEFLNFFLLSHDLYKINYYILGDGYYMGDLRKHISGISLNPNFKIFLEGFCADIDKYFKHADIFLYNSELDARPNVLLEARFYGLPIILNNFLPFYEIIPEEQGGFYFERGKPMEFCKILLDVIENHMLQTKAFGKEAIYFLKENSLEAISKKWETFLQKI